MEKYSKDVFELHQLYKTVELIQSLCSEKIEYSRCSISDTFQSKNCVTKEKYVTKRLSVRLRGNLLVTHVLNPVSLEIIFIYRIMFTAFFISSQSIKPVHWDYINKLHV